MRDRSIHAQEVRFDAGVWAELVAAADDAGISTAEFLRAAVVARLASDQHAAAPGLQAKPRVTPTSRRRGHARDERD